MIYAIYVFVCFFFISVSYGKSKKAVGSLAEVDECIKCHLELTPGLVKEWQKSEHGKKNIKCINCHKAEQNDPDAFLHNGYTIATIVSPKDCAKCHIKEEKEFTDSHHS